MSDSERAAPEEKAGGGEAEPPAAAAAGTSARTTRQSAAATGGGVAGGTGSRLRARCKPRQSPRGLAAADAPKARATLIATPSLLRSHTTRVPHRPPGLPPRRLVVMLQMSRVRWRPCRPRALAIGSVAPLLRLATAAMIRPIRVSNRPMRRNLRRLSSVLMGKSMAAGARRADTAPTLASR